MNHSAKKEKWFSVLILFILLLGMSCTVYAAKETVAIVSGKTYTSLSKAVKAVKNGQTITLLEDISTNETVTISKAGKSFTINFAGNVYSYTGTDSAFNMKAGNVTIKNGSIKSSNYIFSVKKKAKITISGGKYTGYNYNVGTFNIKNGTFSSKGVPQSEKDELLQNYGKMTISKGIFYGEDDNAVLNAGTLTIKNGTYKTDAQSDDGMYAAIYNISKGTCVIENGKYTGKECAVLNEGDITINGGTYKGTKMNTIANAGEMEINGGTYKSGNKSYFLVWNTGTANLKKGTFTGAIGNTTKGKKTLKISGGKYSCSYQCALWIKEGVVNVSSGTFTTKKNNTVVVDTKGTLKATGGTFKCTGYYYALSNYGKVYLKGGKFTTKGKCNSILSNSGSVLQLSKRVKYTGDVDYE